MLIGSRGRSRRVAIGAAVVGTVAMALAGALPSQAATAATAATGPGTPEQQWAGLQKTLAAINGEWTDQNYAHSVTDVMPETALLGNGDVGVTSGGSTGVKSFYVSKGDFWNANPSPTPVALGGVTLKSATPAPGANLALGATATASSSNGSLTPDRAVNGQWTSGYEGWVSAVGATQWISLDLGSVQQIGRFVIRNDNAARPGNAANDTRGFDVQTSPDGTTWTTVETVANNTQDIIDQALPSAVSSRYVRFSITAPTQADTPDTQANPRARIGQIQLYAPSSDPDLALAASATASSTLSPYTPDRAVSGQWTASGGYQGWVSNLGKPQSLSLDLGSVQNVARFVIRNDNDARPGNQPFNTKDVTVEASTDGSTWSTISTVTGNSADVIDRDITPVNARYLRFDLVTPTQESTDDSTQNPRGRIGQIELYPLAKSVQDPDAAPPAGPFQEEQHIVDGRVTTSMSIQGTPVTMTTWIAPDTDVIVSQVTSQGKAPVTLRSQTWSGAAGNQNNALTNTASVSGSSMTATRSTAPGANWVSEASMTTRILGADSMQAPSVTGSTAQTDFTLKPGHTATILTAVAGGGQNPTGTAAAATALAAKQSAMTVAVMAMADTAWWKAYWLRSTVTVSDQALMRYYYAAQYFLGSATRQGKLPPALYGIWTTTDSPRYTGDYHNNYNDVSTFYGSYSSNRPEQALPMVGVFDAYVPEGQRRAKTDLNRVMPSYIASRFPSGGLPADSTGVLFPVGIGPYGSTTTDGYYQQVSDSLFAATTYSEYYSYTQDDAFLAKEAMPFLSDVANFFQYYLEKDPATGQYSLWSGPQEGLWGKNSSADLGMLKQTLQTLIAGVDELGSKANPAWVSADPTWKDMLAHLPAQPTTTVNGKTVYSLVQAGTMDGAASGGDTRDIHLGDNTVNLEFIAPADQLGIDSDPAAKQTAIDTLDAMNSWGQENSFVKVFTQAARVGYPAQSLISKFDQQLAAHTAANLAVNDEDNGIEKSGATEAVNDLLVQSDQNVLSLFPELPAGQSASFTNLLQPGAFVVSSALANGSVQYAQITSRAGRHLALKNPWGGQRISVTDQQGRCVAYQLRNGVISFDTHAGATYSIAPSSKR